MLPSSSTALNSAVHNMVTQAADAGVDVSGLANIRASKRRGGKCVKAHRRHKIAHVLHATSSDGALLAKDRCVHCSTSYSLAVLHLLQPCFVFQTIGTHCSPSCGCPLLPPL